MRIKSVFCKMGGLLQGEGKGSRVLWRQQLLWRKWGNGSRSDRRSCLCASTHDAQGLGDTPRNKKAKRKLKFFFKLMIEEKKVYKKVKE